MGKRLINTNSVVQDILTKTYYSYHLYNGNILNKEKELKKKKNTLSMHKKSSSHSNIAKSYLNCSRGTSPDRTIIDVSRV